MAYFSEEDYMMMVEELEQEPSCFDRMLKIAEAVLVPYVRQNCYGELADLREDILQEIYLIMVKKCVTGYLRNENGEKSADGFQAWMKKIARNKINDRLEELKRQRELREKAKAQNIVERGSSLSPESKEYIQRQIAAAVRNVMKTKTEPHILLTWLLVCILILARNEDKKKVNHIIKEKFCDKSLDEIVDFIEKTAGRIWWMPITAADIQTLRKSLDKQNADGRRLGDMRYGEFEMKKGILASISDWTNRMNNHADEDEKDKEKKYLEADKNKKNDSLKETEETEGTDDESSYN